MNVIGDLLAPVPISAMILMNARVDRFAQLDRFAKINLAVTSALTEVRTRYLFNIYLNHYFIQY